VPVAAGVVGDPLEVAAIAGLDVTTQGGGAAAGNRTQDALLLAT
jgi:hypothetical protein